MLNNTHDDSIETLEEFDEYKENVLSHLLDSAVLEEFSNSVKFSSKGFCTAKYSVIEDKLSFKEFVRLFNNLGMDLNKFADHVDYICDGGSCRAYEGYICNPDTCE
ncbi:hypothetical protein [Bacillus sp. 'calajunan']|uniref:hypothetical protein n=1 Tax=Bacillus sp. 'calajunan' TaxID=3447457 RepID=UPI003F4B4B36